MTFGAVLKFLTALFTVVPAIKSLWDSFISFYISQEIARMKAENREAIRKAFSEFDQRPIEKVIGSKKTGEPSGMAGTEFRDSLPGVMQDPKSGKN